MTPKTQICGLGIFFSAGVKNDFFFFKGGVFSLTAAVRTWVDLPTPHLKQSRAPGGRATRALHEKAQGLFAGLGGGLTFPGHRSEVKETLPEGRPLTTLVWKSLVRGFQSQNNASVLLVENTIRLPTTTNMHEMYVSVPCDDGLQLHSTWNQFSQFKYVFCSMSVKSCV